MGNEQGQLPDRGAANFPRVSPAPPDPPRSDIAAEVAGVLRVKVSQLQTTINQLRAELHDSRNNEQREAGRAELLGFAKDAWRKAMYFYWHSPTGIRDKETHTQLCSLIEAAERAEGEILDAVAQPET